VNLISYYYIFGTDFTNLRLFSEIFKAPFQGITKNVREVYVVTDGGAIQGMSSWDSYRIMLNILLFNIKSNLTTNTPVYNVIYGFTGLVILGYYYCKNLVVTESKCYVECLTLLMVGMAFHTGSADYNLILLTPLIFLILKQYDFSSAHDIVKPLFILFSLIGGYVLYLVPLEPHSKTYLSMSLKSLLTPFLLTYSIIHCIKFRKI